MEEVAFNLDEEKDTGEISVTEKSNGPMNDETSHSVMPRGWLSFSAEKAVVKKVCQFVKVSLVRSGHGKSIFRMTVARWLQRQVCSLIIMTLGAKTSQ